MPGPFSSAAPRSVPGADPDGVLLVDKPAGVTSSDVVVAVRRMFKLKKVGHGGTLDPQATGLLVLLVGRGTKLSSAAMSGDKTYEGVLRLGVATNTQDAGGEVVFRGDPSGVTRETLEALVASDFTGDVFQTPPRSRSTASRSTRGPAREKRSRASHDSSTSSPSASTSSAFPTRASPSVAPREPTSARSATTSAKR